MAVLGTDLPKTTKLADLTDEQITDIKKLIEGFAQKSEYFSKFTQKEGWDRNSKTMQFRRYVANKVDPSSIHPVAEEVAPRPTSVTIKTYQRSIKRYSGRWNYTREMTNYGYDNIVAIGADVLKDEITQKKDIIIGTPFFKGRATQDVVNNSVLKTLEKIAVMFTRQNHCRPYADGKYLAMVTPETMVKIREEIGAKNGQISEGTKEMLDRGIVASYGRWLFTECPSKLALKVQDEEHADYGKVHYMVCMARRPDGSLPIVQSNKHDVEVYHNPLGTGILLDEDGKLTDDANKQLGSIAWNIDGLTADVNDDLCLIRTEITIGEIYEYPYDNAQTLDGTAQDYGVDVAPLVSSSKSPTNS